METVEHGNPEKINEAKKHHEALAVRRARITAIVFGVITTLALISLVYGFVKHRQVEAQTKRADSLQVLTDSLRVQIQKSNSLFELNSKLAKQMAEEVEKAKK